MNDIEDALKNKGKLQAQPGVSHETPTPPTELRSYKDWQTRWEQINGIAPQDPNQKMTKAQFISMKKKEIMSSRKAKFGDALRGIFNALGGAGKSGFQKLGERAQNMQGFDRTDKEE